MELVYEQFEVVMDVAILLLTSEAENEINMGNFLLNNFGDVPKDWMDRYTEENGTFLISGQVH